MSANSACRLCMGPGTSSLTASMTVRRIVRKYASRAGASNTTQGDLQGLVRVIDEAAEKGYARGSTVDTVRQKQIRNEEGVRIVSLYESKPLRPGDLTYKRMFPPIVGQRKPNTVLANTSLGPSSARSKQTDWFLRSGNIDPLKESMNTELLSRYVTNFGKIMNRAQTQLTWTNQRRMGKAVRRARSMAIIPYFADWSMRQTRESKFQAFGMTMSESSDEGVASYY